MRNIRLFLLTSALILTTGLAANAQEWTKFAPDGGRFEVLLPGTPTPSVSTTQSENGPYTTSLYLLRAGTTLYLMGYVDYDPNFNFNIKAEIVANKDNFLKGLKGSKLLNEKETTFEGNPGLDFTAELEDGRFVSSKVFVVGRRPYQLVGITPKGADQGDVVKFFRSFKLKKS